MMSFRSMCLVLAVCLPWTLAQAATVYRTTDAQGNVVFTDKPMENAQRIKLEPLTVVPSPEPGPASAAPRLKEKASTAPRSPSSSGPFMPYSTFGIASPTDEETLPTGYAGNVRVALNIVPNLRDDHRVRLLLDGRVSQSAMHTSTFMLTNLERGEHQVRAELLDANGRVRHRSAPITLYVQRASVNLPANPNNPSNMTSNRTSN